METKIMNRKAGNGYNINLKEPGEGFTKLHRASLLGNQDEVRTCLKTIPINVKDADMRTPLHIAASIGNTTIVRLLMEKELNFNERDSYGKTPIMKAIEGSHKETIKAMIAKGVCLTASDRNGNNAMHMALIEGHYDIAKLMLQYFPNCNVSNVDGITPFHILAESTQVKLARRFIDHGASINTVDHRGRSPLMLASKRGCFPMVSMLLKNGANPELRDSNGWTSLDYASIMGHTQVTNLLQGYLSGEISPKKDDFESSSSSEEEITGGRVYESFQRIIPIRIESQSMFLKRQRRPTFQRLEKKEPEGVRDGDGNLLPMPDVVAAMQNQANKLGDIHSWLLHHQQRIEVKRKEYEELKVQAKKLWEERQKLLKKQDERRLKAKDLVAKQENVLNIKEAECLREQVDVLKNGLQELRTEHERSVAERDELQNILQKGHSINKGVGASMAEKTQHLQKENEMLYGKLHEIQNQARHVTEDLTKKCKTADELVRHLKIVLRGTYRLLEEKHKDMDKVMKEVDDQQCIITNTNNHFNTIKEENNKVGKNIEQVDSKMKAVRKYLAKVHKEMENHPFAKSLREAGIIDGDEAKKSSSEIIKKKKKGSHQELEPEPEVKSLADEKLNLGLLMSPNSSVPTVCETNLETVKYSWLNDDDDDQPMLGDEAIQSIINKEIEESNDFEEPEGPSNEESTHKDDDDDITPPHLQAKLASVAAKYSR